MKRKISVLIVSVMFCAILYGHINASVKKFKEYTTEPKVIIEANTNQYDVQQKNDFDVYDVYLLTKIAMAEAEGESIKTKAMVIQVVLNRVNSERFPDTIKEVIYQTKQFSPIDNGRFDRVEPNEDCIKAMQYIEASSIDITNGALYFETATNEETWHTENLEYLFTSGRLNFYKEMENE